MGLFGNKKNNEGGIMDAIRCDESDFLIWKWRPNGMEAGSTKKENAIRTGSSLSVRDGQVAVFQYAGKGGGQCDYITGPYNDTVKTQNFPVLTGIIGLAFGGGTPFQAEVYYINMAGLIHVQFAVPYFDVFDPRLPDMPIQMAVRGSFAFGISDYQSFIRLHSLTNFDMEAFKKQIKDALVKYVKAVVTNIPDGSYGGAPIAIVQMERRILQVNELVQQYVEPKLATTYGVTIKSFDISELDIDKTCEGYLKVKELTADYAAASTKQQQDINLGNQRQMNDLQMNAMAQNQEIQMQNMAETLRINREEAQHAQHAATDVNAYAAKLGAQSQNLGAFAIQQQTEVGVAAAEAMGKQGASGAGNVNLGAGGNGMNPGAMMANMAMGAAVGQGMANMLGNSFAGASTGMGAGIMPGMAAPMGGMPGSMPPSLPQGAVQQADVYYVSLEAGKQSGPYSGTEIAKLVMERKVLAETPVWKSGMEQWKTAVEVEDVAALLNLMPPQTAEPQTTAPQG